MGQMCCDSKKYYTDNDAENFVQEIISNLRIKKYKHADIIKAFQKCIKTESFKKENKIKEMVIFFEESYEYFIMDLFKNIDDIQSPYFKFQNAIAPTYDEIAENDKYDYNISLYCLSLVSDDNKDYIIETILKTYTYNSQETILFSSFQKFLSQYLEYNLHKITQRAIRVLKDLNEKIIIQHRKIDSKFKKIGEELEKDYKIENINILEKKIIYQLEKILNPKFKNANIDEEIQLSHIKQLVAHFPWLFDCLELRNHFYENRKLYQSR